MKPGKATAQTMIEHVLNFETSPHAMRRQSWMRALKDKVLDAAALHLQVREILDKKSLFRLHAGLKHMFVAHRELRRAARRMAKLALSLLEEQRKDHAEHDALVTRIIKLEAENERLKEKNRSLEYGERTYGEPRS